MKIAFFLNRLNHHQVNVADNLYTLLGEDYKFVELCEPNVGSQKGDFTDYSQKPYLIQAWKSISAKSIASQIADTFDACIFGTLASLPYQKQRLKKNKLSFEVSERWLKQGFKNILSPTISKMFMTYWLEGWNKKKLYKLCSSAFASSDHYRLGMYKGRCYKWGYFTRVAEIETCSIAPIGNSKTRNTSLMWCSRYLLLKHPELPILMAERLKKTGCCFHLDMYGEGEYKQKTIDLVESLGLSDCVSFIGSKPNSELMEDMKKHDIFLFTSDKNEGWGAVANESMSNGCVLVGSDAVGSAPYLIKEGNNGFMFKSSKTSCSFNNPDLRALDSLCEKVEWLLAHPIERMQMRENAVKQMHELWSPENAAKSLVVLIENIMQGFDTPLMEGPCSKA